MKKNTTKIPDMKKQIPKKSLNKINLDAQENFKEHEDEFSEIAIPLKDPTKFNKGIRRLKQRYMRNMKPKVVTIINMELQNGKHDTFYIEHLTDSFIFNKGRYIFDNVSCIFHVGFNCWIYDYREGFSLPIKREPIPINDIRKAFETSKTIDYEYSLNAKNLEQFQVSKVIEAVLSGQALSDIFKKNMIIVIIILILSLINMFGVFQLYSMIKALGGA